MRKLILEELKERRDQKPSQRMPVALLLEKIRSIHNVGSFFRTADGAGVEKIYLTGYTAVPPRPEISKVALGAEEVVPWEQTIDAAEAARKIKQEGYTLVAVEHTDESRDLYDGPLPFPCCLVFGHEVEGVSDELIALCDTAIEVPMHGEKESLNVSVCAGVVLFEVRRMFELLQRTDPGESDTAP